MNRDVINQVQAQYAQLVTPGISAIAANPGATGVVTVDPSSAALGSFKAVVNVVTPGPLGTAQVQVSLDGGNNFDSAVVLPVSGQLPLTLLDPSPGLVSQVLSGLVLTCSGNFTAGDSYSFTANGTVTFLYGKNEQPSQDSLYPRVLWLPAADDFEGTEDWTQGQDQRTQPRSLVSAAARFETHCWGIDYDRAEVLRDQVINAIALSLKAEARFEGGEWPPAAIAQAGRNYVLRWRIRKPVADISNQWVISQPPHTGQLTATTFDSQ